MREKSKRGSTHVVQHPKLVGRYFIQPPIEHPPECLYKWCRTHRRTDDWGKTITVRINRLSIFPHDEMKSVGYAAEVKKYEEKKLRDAVEQARLKNEALAAAVTFGTLCDMYRHYQKEQGKRYDRDRYRIDVIEEFIGRSRDAASIGLDDADALSSHLRLKRGTAQETINRYLNTLIAVLNHGKAKRKIHIMVSKPCAVRRRRKEEDREHSRVFKWTCSLVPRWIVTSASR